MKCAPIFLLAMAFFTAVASSQSTDPAQAFSDLSVGDAEILINNTGDVDSLLAFVNSAIASRRMDLIKLCFENQHTRPYALRESMSIEDPLIRAKVAIIMLRDPSRFYRPDENPLTSRGSAPMAMHEIEPFVSTVTD